MGGCGVLKGEWRFIFGEIFAGWYVGQCSQRAFKLSLYVGSKPLKIVNLADLHYLSYL